MAKPVSKAALVADLATEAETSKKAANEFLNALTKVVTQRLIAGDTIRLPQLVMLETRDRPARLVRSPATGEMINKDADKAVKAQPAIRLKVAVNA